MITAAFQVLLNTSALLVSVCVLFGPVLHVPTHSYCFPELFWNFETAKESSHHTSRSHVAARTIQIIFWWYLNSTNQIFLLL